MLRKIKVVILERRKILLYQDRFSSKAPDFELCLSRNDKHGSTDHAGQGFSLLQEPAAIGNSKMKNNVLGKRVITPY